jgi:hypothetical protein
MTIAIDQRGNAPPCDRCGCLSLRAPRGQYLALRPLWILLGTTVVEGVGKQRAEALRLRGRISLQKHCKMEQRSWRSRRNGKSMSTMTVIPRS